MNELSRREFLSSAAATSFVIAIHLDLDRTLGCADATQCFAPNAWLKVENEGMFFILNKAEMGQGVYTTLTLVVAEEIGVNPEVIQIRNAPADRAYVNPTSNIQITGGSTSVSSTFEVLRQAAATLRTQLLLAASKKLGVSESECVIEADQVSRKHSADKIPFKDLIPIASALPVPTEVILKQDTSWKFIGRDFNARLDNALKISGKAEFGIDVQLPGMLCATIIRTPKLGGKVKSFDASSVTGMPGVRHVVQIPTGVAIVADKYWQASKAREVLSVDWIDDSKLSKLSTDNIAKRFRERMVDKGKVLKTHGNFVMEIENCPIRVNAEYELPYLAHATMEPCNFTADVRKDSAHLYGPTQSAGIAQQVTVEITGLPYEMVFVNTTFLGGGFGRRLQQDYVAEAVYLSKAIQRPVKIVWTREDDIQNSMYRPANLHQLRGGLSVRGDLIAWSHKMVGPSILSQIASDYARTSFPQWIPNWAKGIGGALGTKSFQWLSNDQTAMEGASNLAYEVPHCEVIWVQEDPGVPLGFWRSVGHSYTGFVVESFIDEMARAARKDPFEFRRAYLKHAESARNLGVLELVADEAGWKQPKKKGIGRGIAQHVSFGSYVAYVVELRLSSDSEIRIERVVAAVDCGLVVNPDGARAQIESAVNFGLSAILKGEITIADGAVEQSNFDTYELIRMHEAPKNIEIHFVKNTYPPTGLGEPGVPPLGAAVANAFFDLTGKRLRKLPLKP